jgi:hypothetical protein
MSEQPPTPPITEPITPRTTKKPYSKPKLTEYGSLVEMTQGTLMGANMADGPLGLTKT